MVSLLRMLYGSYADMEETSIANSPETPVAETQASPRLGAIGMSEVARMRKPSISTQRDDQKQQKSPRGKDSRPLRKDPTSYPNALTPITRGE